MLEVPPHQYPQREVLEEVVAVEEHPPAEERHGEDNQWRHQQDHQAGVGAYPAREPVQNIGPATGGPGRADGRRLPAGRRHDPAGAADPTAGVATGFGAVRRSCRTHQAAIRTKMTVRAIVEPNPTHE